MILLKRDIEKAFKKGKIIFTGDLKKAINPNSINVKLGAKLKTYTPVKIKKTKYGKRIVKINNNEVILDCKSNNKVYSIDIPMDGLILDPSIFYLGHTVEKGGSDFYVPMYEGRSSLARLGLISHFSAGFGDIGFKSQWTLEISVKEPLKVYPDMDIGQIYFVKGSSKKTNDLYIGKYSNQSGVQPSKLHEDFY
ncbi:MAG TPA: dCTP deaminase [Bacteroidia bacterium]|nr:dCTP deaminase [Bacteroidia bacterium]